VTIDLSTPPALAFLHNGQPDGPVLIIIPGTTVHPAAAAR
jgi:hypothetical protein